MNYQPLILALIN